MAYFSADMFACNNYTPRCPTTCNVDSFLDYYESNLVCYVTLCVECVMCKPM